METHGPTPHLPYRVRAPDGAGAPRRKDGDNPGQAEDSGIARAPWREAVTYRNTWPHEYVLSRKDGQRELIEAVRARFRAGEGVAGSFFGRRNTYLFIGDHKYW